MIFQALDHYYSVEDNMSQSVPSYRPGQAHRLEYKDIAKSLHPSREKGQKSSFKRLPNLTSEMRKNQSRYVFYCSLVHFLILILCLIFTIHE